MAFLNQQFKVTRMEARQIELAFHSALKAEADKRGHGVQVWLASEVHVTPQYVYKLIKGTSYGTEETRRRVAAAFGYEYEDFLDIGRKILKLEKGTHPEPKLPFQKQAEEFPAHSEERAHFILAMAGKEMEWPAFANFVDAFPEGKDPLGRQEYFEGTMSDFGLYERAKVMIDKWKGLTGT